jgi:hypothetical protein
MARSNGRHALARRRGCQHIDRDEALGDALLKLWLEQRELFGQDPDRWLSELRKKADSRLRVCSNFPEAMLAAGIISAIGGHVYRIPPTGRLGQQMGQEAPQIPADRSRSRSFGTGLKPSPT